MSPTWRMRWCLRRRRRKGEPLKKREGEKTRDGGQRMKKGKDKPELLFEAQEVREVEAEGREGAVVLAVLAMLQVDRVAQEVEEHHKREEAEAA